jgi:hypothetical protein
MLENLAIWSIKLQQPSASRPGVLRSQRAAVIARIDYRIPSREFGAIKRVAAC